MATIHITDTTITGRIMVMATAVTTDMDIVADTTVDIMAATMAVTMGDITAATAVDTMAADIMADTTVVDTAILYKNSVRIKDLAYS
jgi:hypothetical protein